ncbi:MAG: FAD-dependent oxidoreductase, partial [Pseudomonadales bacterium]
MLTKEILDTLKSYANGMQKRITFVVQTGTHSKRDELIDFLTQIASVSDKLSVEERNGSLHSPISFTLEADDKPTGIMFSGIPGGHEFNSLILAMLQSAGTPVKLDSSVQTLVGNISEELRFEVFVSLSCHNCPDVVQTLNQFALINDNISAEMIDGGLFQNVVKERDIQGVPCVYLNGELFANGKVDPASLVDKLIEKYPDSAQDKPVLSELPEQDVTVVGGGPAGVSAAIYSARKGLKVTLITDWIGGQVKDTMGIENLISVPKTTGPELVSALKAHMNEYEITLKHHIRVSEIADLGKRKEVRLSTGEKILTKTVILATGARWRELGIPGEKKYTGKGVA